MLCVRMEKNQHLYNWEARVKAFVEKAYKYWMFCLSNVQSLLFIMIIYELLLLVN
jgi:hypothetical protein